MKRSFPSDEVDSDRKGKVLKCNPSPTTYYSLALRLLRLILFIDK